MDIPGTGPPHSSTSSAPKHPSTTGAHIPLEQQRDSPLIQSPGVTSHNSEPIFESAYAFQHTKAPSGPQQNNENQKSTVIVGNNDAASPAEYRDHQDHAVVGGLRNLEAVFHPELHRTKEVIRKPQWLTSAATGETLSHRGKLNALALFGMLFANCIGGGYGFEDGISAAGPLITLIVCLLLPWIWCFPTGLAVAELSTSVPSNSGVLMWTNAAFPPFISFLCILGTVFIIFIGNATYPNLTAEYFSNLLELNQWQLMIVKVAVIALCCFVNCVGVEVVGTSTVILCCITITPFILLTLIQLFGHGFNDAILHVDLKEVNWSDFFSIISWNYANIENAGAVVEEVANPQITLPKSMAMLMFGSYVAYVIPMLAGVSAMGPGQDYSQWVAGHWPDVAEKVAGPWLKYTLFVAAIFSGVGFTVTSLCCTSRLLAGIGTMRIFPKKMSRFIGYYHPRLGTPIVAIIINSLVTMAFSLSMDFGDVVALCQSLYCLRMLLIYGAVIKLRITYPNLIRPYKLPCSTLYCALCLLPAAVFSIFAAIVSSLASNAIMYAMVGFLVGGCAISWLYCKFVATNGFQGVIVHYWDETAEETEEFLSKDALHAESEGTDLKQGQRKRPVTSTGTMEMEDDDEDFLSPVDERAAAGPLRPYSPTAEVTWHSERAPTASEGLRNVHRAEYKPYPEPGNGSGIRRRHHRNENSSRKDDLSSEAESSTDDERYEEE